MRLEFFPMDVQHCPLELGSRTSVQSLAIPLLSFLVPSACVRLRADGYSARTLQYVWGIDGSLVSFDTDAMMRNGVLELAQFDLVTWNYYNGSHRYDTHGTTRVRALRVQ